jgi:hypothetical protein
LLPLWIHNWGSTAAEINRTLPGDEIYPDAAVKWNHAVTINANPEAVWPWIAQVGDVRGGFYSYTFIENIVAEKTYITMRTPSFPNCRTRSRRQDGKTRLSL